LYNVKEYLYEAVQTVKKIEIHEGVFWVAYPKTQL
jgi:hypothetical protein